MDTFFSVVIPVHNKEPHLDRSINSVLNQTHPNFELIIVDDASTDGSSKRLDDFTDPRITRLKRDLPGPGGYAARNMAIDAAKHNWICFLDADDEWETDLLATLNSMIAQNPTTTIFSWGWSRKQGNEITPNPYFAKHKDNGKPYFKYKLVDFFNGPSRVIWTGAVCINKSVFAKAGNFPEDRCIRGGDVDLWIRCLDVSDDNIYINKNFTFYYIDAVNMVTRGASPPIPCFYSTTNDILQRTDDKPSVAAINKFQNEGIYDVAQRNANYGYKIDYSLLSKMTLSKYSIVSIIKIHVKRLRSLLKKG